MKVLAVILALAGAGCLRSTTYKCESNEQCGGTGGACESTGFCSFTDTTCDSGRIYGDYAGSLSGKCVGAVDPNIDGGMTDTPMGDVPAGGCPASYAALPGVTGHVYRVITATALWDAQVTSCMNDSGTTYLAVPDDQAELTAIITAANANFVWVGINDKAAEGTYATTNGGSVAANSALWKTGTSGEPNNTPSSGGGGPDGADCVAGDQNDNNLADDRCDTKSYKGVCECEP